MPRRLLRDGRVVDDDWLYLTEAAGNAAAPLILTLSQWQNERDVWIARGGRLGVVLSPAHKVELLVPDLARLDLVGAEFTGPSEGRGYSQARLLREHWKFGGELRATGFVRRDQLILHGALRIQQLRIAGQRDRQRRGGIVDLFRRLSTLERRRAAAQAAAPPVGYTCQRLKRSPTLWPTPKRSPSKRSRLISASNGSLTGWPSAHSSSRTIGPITRTAVTIAGQPAASGPISISCGRISAM